MACPGAGGWCTEDAKERSRGAWFGEGRGRDRLQESITRRIFLDLNCFFSTVSTASANLICALSASGEEDEVSRERLGASGKAVLRNRSCVGEPPPRKEKAAAWWIRRRQAPKSSRCILPASSGRGAVGNGGQTLV
eukprot:1917753-Rhodomonas_salina.1